MKTDRFGFIIDNMGQWKYPGRKTLINSNKITTEDMDPNIEAVIGIGGDGQTIVMDRDQNYEFNEPPVREIPIMNDGSSRRRPIRNFFHNRRMRKMQPPVNYKDVLGSLDSQESNIQNSGPVIDTNEFETIQDVQQPELSNIAEQEEQIPDIQQTIEPIEEESEDEHTKRIQKELAENGYYDQLIESYSKRDIMAIQRILKQNGYDLGNYGINHDGIDGILGEKTLAAWRQYNIDGIKGKFTDAALSLYEIDNNDAIKKNDAIAEGYDGASEVDIEETGTIKDPDGCVGTVTKEEGDVVSSDVTIDYTDKTTKNISQEKEKITTVEYSGNEAKKKQEIEEEKETRRIIKDIIKNKKNRDELKKKTFAEIRKEVIDRENERKYALDPGLVPLSAYASDFIEGHGIMPLGEDLKYIQEEVSMDKFRFKNKKDIPRTIYNYDSGKDAYWCSEGLQLFALSKGIDLKKYGIRGNAWEMLDYMSKSKNSEVIYNAFDNYDMSLSPDMRKQRRNVQSYMSKVIATDEYKEAMKDVRTGDVVTLLCRGSDKYSEAYEDNKNLDEKCYTTHIGIVISAGEGNKYVWHYVHGKSIITPLSKAISNDNSKYKISGIGRCNELYSQYMYDPSRYGVTINEASVNVDGNPEVIKKHDKLFNATSYRVYGTLSENSEILMKETGVKPEDYDFLSHFAVSAMFIEQDMGQAGKSKESRRNIGDAIIPGYVKGSYRTGYYSRTSLGPTLFKTLSDASQFTKGRTDHIQGDVSLTLGNLKLRNYTRFSYDELNSLGLTDLLNDKDITNGDIKMQDENARDVKIIPDSDDMSEKIIGTAINVYGNLKNIKNKKTIASAIMKHEVTESPEFSAQMCFRSIAKQSQILDNILEQNNMPKKYKEKNVDNLFYTTVMAISWNQGIDHEKTLGYIKKVKYIYDNYGEKAADNFIRNYAHLDGFGHVRSTYNTNHYINMDLLNESNYKSDANIGIHPITVYSKGKSSVNFSEYGMSHRVPIESIEGNKRIEDDSEYQQSNNYGEKVIEKYNKSKERRLFYETHKNELCERIIELYKDADFNKKDIRKMIRKS